MKRIGLCVFQIPVKARKPPLVLWHNCRQVSETWETTPDGREGYQNIFLGLGFGVYTDRLKWRRIERRKSVETPISRRSFLMKSCIALGTVAVCNVDGIGGADPVGGLNTLPGELKEKTMPHVIVKLYPGRSEQQKIRLAEQITKDVVDIIRCDESSVSVAIEEIKPADWEEKVYKPDILKNSEKLYKKPGYKM